jgi:predicted O-methyltransferase YrrM
MVCFSKTVPHVMHPLKEGFMNLLNRYVRRNFVKESVCKVYDTLEYGFHHPWSTLKIKSHESTVDFIENHCPRAIACRSPRQLMDLALTHVTGAGAILEFGVFRGDSLLYIANRRPHNEIHGFDCFEGLPTGWAHNPQGTFNVAGKLPNVPDNVKLWKGYFEDTLPPWSQAFEGTLAMVHIDCDLNASTRTIFDYLGSRLDQGTVLLFDDYFNFPGWQKDGHAVFTQFVEKYGWQVNYLGYAYKELAVVIS